MHTKMAATVAITASLAVLMSGCAGAAALGGQVRDDLRPAANAAVMGLARGHVIVRDDLSPNRIENRITAESVARAVEAESARSFSADARRELHAQQPAQSVTVEQPFSAEVWRELKGIAPVTAEQPFSAEAIRELKGSAPVGVSAADMQGTRLSAYAEARAAASVTAAEMQGKRLSAYGEARTDAAIRELKGSAPVVVHDDLSPLGDGTPTSPSPTDTVDDDQSPLEGSH
jgi:hypothetical protein